MVSRTYNPAFPIGRAPSFSLPAGVGGGGGSGFVNPVIDYSAKGTLIFDLDPRTGGSTIPIDATSKYVNGNITDANGSGRTINYISGKNGVFHTLRSEHGDLVLDFDGGTGSILDMLTGISELANLVNGTIHIEAVIGYDSVSSNDLYMGAELAAGNDRVWYGGFKQWNYNSPFTTPAFNDTFGHIITSSRIASEFTSKRDGIHNTGSPASISNTATLGGVHLGGLNAAGANTGNLYLKRMLIFSDVPSDLDDIRDSLSYEHKIPQPDHDYDVFILAGQSNMAGQSQEAIESQDQPYNPYISQVGRNASYDMKIINAVQELSHKGGADGPGLGMQFAIDYAAANPNKKILLVPVAEGNTGFSTNDWNAAGDVNYDDCVARANAAMAYGSGTKTLKGMLWHQGEQDTSMSQAAHSAAFDAMLTGFETDITGFTSSTPILVGDLAPNFAVSGHLNIRASNADAAVRHSNVKYVPSTGLTDRGDNTHLDRASLRSYGSDYHTTFQTF